MSNAEHLGQVTDRSRFGTSALFPRQEARSTQVTGHNKANLNPDWTAELLQRTVVRATLLLEDPTVGPLSDISNCHSSLLTPPGVVDHHVFL